jgi:lipoprotein-anchoring transpeptidase ErfK/SrfK
MARKKVRKKYNWPGLIGIFAFFVLIGFFILQKSLTPYCANSISCKESFNLKVENGATGVFDGQKIAAPAVDLAEKPSTKVLGEATLTGDKHIYVDLTNQTLTAYQGDTVFMQVPIASGKWHPTPDGEFTIWEKVRATRMTGGTGADYYDLPNVPFVMFFGGSGVPDGAGFSLHGTYWHDNFGHPMSHGCVNMRIVDAEKLFYWADLSTTKITIYGTAPI